MPNLDAFDLEGFTAAGLWSLMALKASGSLTVAGICQFVTDNFTGMPSSFDEYNAEMFRLFAVGLVEWSPYFFDVSVKEWSITEDGKAMLDRWMKIPF